MIFRCKQIILWVLAFVGFSKLIGISEVYADNRPPAPPTSSPSGSRYGGGTRPEASQRCPETMYPPTAITPENANGTTTLEYPVFWFYIPYTSNTVDLAEFTLLNQSDTQTLYQTTIQLDSTPGIISVAIPHEQVSPLEQNSTYRWYFKLNCQPVEPGELNDVLITGWITRADANEEYRWDGVWYDTLNDIAISYQENPQDPTLQASWAELLNSVALDYLVDILLLD